MDFLHVHEDEFPVETVVCQEVSRNMTDFGGLSSFSVARPTAFPLSTWSLEWLWSA